MKVLVACEFSGIVREAFKKRGYDAWSCDLLPTEIEGKHIQGDVLDILNDGWDLMIAHPPCTYLCNSGVRWLFTKDEDKNIKRIDKMEKAFHFFMMLWRARINKICVENPIPHPYGLNLVNPGKYSQLIQPHYFIGSNESKATCLWLKGLPKLKRTQWLDKTRIKQSVFRMPPSENRGLERSRFPLAIAKAMAEQWGNV